MTDKTRSPKKPATRGPVPKRSAEKVRYVSEAEQPDRVSIKGDVPIPLAPDEWDKRAKDWYDSLAKSGQSRYYEPSDWEYARILGDLLSKQIVRERPSSEMVKAILSAMGNLGTTEGDRLRMRIEIDRSGRESDGGETEADVAVLEQYRRISKEVGRG